MDLFKCTNCGCYTLEPKELHTTYGALYGVSGYCAGNHVSLRVCPECNQDELVEADEWDVVEDIEWYRSRIRELKKKVAKNAG